MLSVGRIAAISGIVFNALTPGDKANRGSRLAFLPGCRSAPSSSPPYPSRTGAAPASPPGWR